MKTTKIPSQEEEYRLFLEYKNTKDKKLRDEIIEKYLYIAKILSKRFINKGIDYDDIYQVASMGIIYSVERFDVQRGVRFATFATPTVLGEIRKYFRDKGNFIRVPASLYDIFYKAEKIKRASGFEKHSPQDLSRVLHLPLEDIERLYRMKDFTFIESLEYEAYADGKLTLSDIIGREEHQFIMIEDSEFLNYCKKKLSQKEIEFVKLRYYGELTQTEISNQWNVSQMYVSRFEKSLLKKLRDMYFR